MWTGGKGGQKRDFFVDVIKQTVTRFVINQL